MAVTITSTPPRVSPIYSNILWTVNDTVHDITSYIIDVTINGETTSLNKFTINSELTFDISSILSGYISSEIFTHGNFNEQFVNGLFDYDITITGYYEGGTTTVSANDYFFYNGTLQHNQTWDYNDWVIGSTATKPLNVKADRYIKLTDKDLPFQFFQGNFGDFISVIPTLTVTDFKGDGTSTSSTIDIPPNTIPKILSVNFSPFYINSETTLDINGDSSYYVISGLYEDIKINIDKGDIRFTPYPMLWVGVNGQTDRFNFNKNSNTTYKIKRDDYNSVNAFNKKRHYVNTEVDEEITINSGFICYKDSEYLKTLFFSPKTAFIDQDESVVDVLVDESKVKLIARVGNDYNYNLTIVKSDEYITQKK